MTREILFRGKRIDNGEWVYGTPIYPKGYDKVIITTGELAVPNVPDFGFVQYEVIPETVGMWTGLTDKNGKKIFEGDIVTGLFNYTNIIGHIVYGSDATFFIERKGLYGIGLNNAEDWLEVVGNIHTTTKNY